MNKMPQVFYTSDPHVGGHKLVAQDRGFMIQNGDVGRSFSAQLGRDVWPADTDAHDATLAANWDAVVRDQDIVFVLGDISIHGKDHVLDWFNARPGTKHLVAGNHDPVGPWHRDAPKHQKRWLETFESINPFLRRKLGGHYFLMSHFPYSGTGAEGHGVEDRYTQYRLPDMGMPLLHGHTHGTERHHMSDGGTPQLHVGLDAWGMELVHQDTVQGWLEHPDSTFYV